MGYLIANSLFYLITLLLTIKKDRRFSLGGYLLLLYFISSVFAILFYMHPMIIYSLHNVDMDMEPFVYLYVVNMVFFLPVLLFNENIVDNIEHPPYNKIKPVLYFVVFFSMVNIIFYMPYFISGLFGDIQGNRADVTVQVLRITENMFIDLMLRIGASLRYMSMFLFFYILTFYPNKKLIIALLAISSFVTPLISSLSYSARGIIIFMVFSLIMNYIIFKRFIDSNVKRVIRGVMIIVLMLFIYIVFVVTMARFGLHEIYGVDFFVLKYPGESWINFNGILYDKNNAITYGDYSFPFFRRILGLEYSKARIDYVDAYQYIVGVPLFVFYQYVGSLYIDFGKYVTIGIATVVSGIGVRYIKSDSVLPFHRLLLLVLYFTIYAEGIFYFSLLSEPGNVSIVLVIIMYLYFRVKFNDPIVFSKR